MFVKTTKFKKEKKKGRKEKKCMDVKQKHIYTKITNLKEYLWHFMAKQQMVAETRIPIKNVMITCGCLTVIKKFFSRSGMDTNKSLKKKKSSSC